MTDQSFDHARSEAFAGRMMAILNGAGTTLMTSIGHQVGLFDTMASLPPATERQSRPRAWPAPASRRLSVAQRRDHPRRQRRQRARELMVTVRQ